MREPLLTRRDLEIWAMWEQTALVHSRTQHFQRKVDQAKRIAEEALSKHQDLAVMWSGGKDSTAMTYLICVEMGCKVPVYSEKDDLDFPGELEYVQRLAAQWNLDLTTLHPERPLIEWLSQNATSLSTEDVHGRSAALSKEHFYQIVEEAGNQHGGIFLGLRKEEGYGRLMNYMTRGTIYQKRNRKWVCTPLANWSGLDVMACLVRQNIEILDMYRCVAFMHIDEPWRIRKSWWLPGAHTRWGQTAWIQHYYPSLFRILEHLFPDARMHV